MMKRVMGIEPILIRWFHILHLHYHMLIPAVYFTRQNLQCKKSLYPRENGALIMGEICVLGTLP